MTIKRVLIVDDSPTERHVLNDMLTKAGYEVVASDNGEDAILKAKTVRPDLILMDLGLACAGQQWLIRLADAGEVIAVPSVATVPLTRPWFLGVANIRGNLYTVIDFGGFLGHAIEPDAPGTTPVRLVLFGPRVGELRAGLVVPRVLGLRNLAELSRADAPSGSPAWYGARC